MPQRLTFRREVFQAKLLAVGIPPTGKKLVASGACWFEFWSLAWQVCEGDRSNLINSLSAYNDVITMISGFWRPLSVPSDYASISRNALHWLLISTIFYSGFLAAKRLISRPIESVPMWPINTRSLYGRDCYLVRRSREGHEWTGR